MKQPIYMTLRLIIFLALLTAIYNYDAISQQTGKITGKVIDSETKKPLARASVTVHDPKDSSAITGGYTDKNGAFSISVANGSYYVRFHYVGYGQIIKNNISINQNKASVDLGSISMKEIAVQTKEVQITAEREQIQVAADRKIFNVENDISTIGGTASDVLANIPSVSVEQDGTVSLRGSSDVRILIDGRPTNLSASEILDQIPASMITSVELITSPGARYDAEGTAGMINIITTREARNGVSAMVNLNAGINEDGDGRGNLGLSGGYNIGKWNVNANINGRLGSRSSEQKGQRTTWQNGDISSILNENSDDTNKNQFISGKISADYNFTKQDVLTGSFNLNNGDRKSNATGNFGILDGDNQLISAYMRQEDNASNMLNTESVLSYKHSFAPKGHDLFIDAYYSTFNRDPHKDYLQIDSIPEIAYSYEQNDNATKGNTFTFQTDYMQSFDEDMKIEVGGKVNARDNNNKTIYENLVNDVWITDPNKSDEFDYTENIYALYATFTDKIGNFGYQLGLRSETTNIGFDSKTVYDRNFDKSYTGFFPSIYFSYELTMNHSFNINAARRLKRPNPWDLNPFIDYENPLILQSGNPNLDPEYLYNLEAGYLLNYDMTTLTATVFYRYTDNMIMRYTTVYDGDTSVTMPFNIASGENTGFEFILMQKLTKWWKVDGNFTLYNSTIDATNIGGVSKNSNIWTTRVNTNFNINKNYDVQLSANYRSPRITAQGEDKSKWGMDLSAKYTFLNSNATLSFNIRDLFGTRTNYSYSQQPGVFYDESERKGAVRQYSLGFTYKFNNYKQKRERKVGDNDMGDGE